MGQTQAEVSDGQGNIAGVFAVEGMWGTVKHRENLGSEAANSLTMALCNKLLDMDIMGLVIFAGTRLGIQTF